MSILLMGLLAIIGCSVGDFAAPGDIYTISEETEMERMVAGSMDMDDSRSVSSGFFQEAPADEQAFADQTQDKTVEAPRMRIYNGEAQLVVESPQETRQRLENRLEEWGGYLESSYGNTLVLRIPAELFYRAFDEILNMGQVLDQRIQTWDVTEQFQDLQGRYDLALETRERLYLLLERSSDPQERSRILREIGRLTEEIEQIRLTLESLENRASLSRITLALQARLVQEEWGREHIPFPWIGNLNPLYSISGEFKGSLDVDLGPGFAVFQDSDYFLAESPRGVIIRMSTLDNHPQGDDAFWQQALAYHLDDFYAQVETMMIPLGEEELSAVYLVSKDREPYGYFVAVKVSGKKLHLLEIFLPDPEMDRTEIFQALEEGRLRG